MPGTLLVQNSCNLYFLYAIGVKFEVQGVYPIYCAKFQLLQEGTTKMTIPELIFYVQVIKNISKCNRMQGYQNGKKEGNKVGMIAHNSEVINPPTEIFFHIRV